MCSIDSCFRESLESDSDVYSRHYPRVDAVFLSGIKELLKRIETGYDVVHFFGRFSGGVLIDASGATLTGSELIEKCCGRDVKLLWIASENQADDYVKGFKAAGKTLNLIMTMSRNGTKFGEFLERLLLKVPAGETLPIAWAALVPQAAGPGHQDLPGCIFYAGRGDLKLLS